MLEALLAAIADPALKTPRQLRAGPGSFDRLAHDAAELASDGTALLVTGSRSARRSGALPRASQFLQQAGFGIKALEVVSGEPTAEEINRMANAARQIAPRLVVGLGGGSVLDSAKALAALAINEGRVEDYLEGVGANLTLRETPLPFVAIPTTAGTGAEMTKNAVIGSAIGKFKKSMRDERMLARLAILDPALTCSVPASVTAAGGMDTITQLIESCISVKRAPATTQLAHVALARVRQVLPLCCTDPRDLAARETMLLASAVSGVCLANSGLALAHGIASGLGGRHAMPHGLICGILLPHTLRHNRDACVEPLGQALCCFLNETEVRADTIDRGIEAIEALNRKLGLPPDLRFMQLPPQERAAVAEASMGSSMSGNPVPMDPVSVDRFLAGIC